MIYRLLAKCLGHRSHGLLDVHLCSKLFPPLLLVNGGLSVLTLTQDYEDGKLMDLFSGGISRAPPQQLTAN